MFSIFSLPRVLSLVPIPADVLDDEDSFRFFTSVELERSIFLTASADLTQASGALGRRLPAMAAGTLPLPAPAADVEVMEEFFDLGLGSSGWLSESDDDSNGFDLEMCARRLGIDGAAFLAPSGCSKRKSLFLDGLQERSGCTSWCESSDDEDDDVDDNLDVDSSDAVAMGRGRFERTGLPESESDESHVLECFFSSLPIHFHYNKFNYHSIIIQLSFNYHSIIIQLAFN